MPKHRNINKALLALLFLLTFSLHAAEEGTGFFGLEVGAGFLQYTVKAPNHTEKTLNQDMEAKHRIEQGKTGFLTHLGINAGYRDYITLEGLAYKFYLSASYATGNPKINIKFAGPEYNKDMSNVRHKVTYWNVAGNFDLVYEFHLNSVAIAPFVGIGLGYNAINVEIEEINARMVECGLHLPLNVGLELIFSNTHILSLVSRIPLLPVTPKVRIGEGKSMVSFAKSESTFSIHNLVLGYAYKF